MKALFYSLAVGVGLLCASSASAQIIPHPHPIHHHRPWVRPVVRPIYSPGWYGPVYSAPAVVTPPATTEYAEPAPPPALGLYRAALIRAIREEVEAAVENSLKDPRR